MDGSGTRRISASSANINSAPNGRLHGLKKSALTALAQGGASIKEMQSISGHKSLAALQGYIDKTDQEQLAEEVMARRTKGRAS
jgi:site-specific recombinase XerD